MRAVYVSRPEGGLMTAEAIEKNSWIHLTAPSDDELREAAEAAFVPEALLRAALDPDEQPRIERRDGAVLIVIHVPYEDLAARKSKDGPIYRLMPVGIVHGKDHLVTVARREVPLFAPFFQGRMNGLATHMKTRLTLKILVAVAAAYLKTVHAVQRDVEQAETELARSYRNDELYTLLFADESLIYLETSLAQMRAVLRKIQNGDYIKLYADDADLLEDAVIDLEQALGAAEVHQQKLNNVMDAYGNVIQINVNAVLKLLTALTVLLSVPILLASVFSMNVPLYIEDRPHGFLIVMTLMSVVTATVGWVFYRLRFF
ncbi:MAG: magnesium transporter CorA family protein [Hydrogenibacillus sp.]|nr:magnesium transporter CorA family protein [Hydrogenibacillus sp.]